MPGMHFALVDQGAAVHRGYSDALCSARAGLPVRGLPGQAGPCLQTELISGKAVARQ